MRLVHITNLGYFAGLFRRLSVWPLAISKHSGPLAALGKWNTIREQGRVEEFDDLAPQHYACLFPTPNPHLPLSTLLFTPVSSVNSQRNRKAPSHFSL